MDFYGFYHIGELQNFCRGWNTQKTSAEARLEQTSASAWNGYSKLHVAMAAIMTKEKNNFSF